MRKTRIVAEMGVNHNGNIDLAKKLILEAAKAGADAVKTQSFHAAAMTSVFAEKAEYQKETTKKDEKMLDMIRKLEVSQADFKELSYFAKNHDIMFFSTPFDILSLKELHELSNQIIKIPSGEITNLPFLIEAGKLSRPVILSTGMSVMEEIAEAVKVLLKNGTKDITLLHCNTQYPTPLEDANLLAIQTLKKEFGLPVGYSDHTPGIEAAVAAVALGAVVIEKHFTLDKNMEGPDHKASLEPSEFKSMVDAIRNVEKAMGDGVKWVTDSERPNMAVARKSIVAAKNIKQGEMFTIDNIAVKRPGNGVSPMKWFEVLGKVAGRDFVADELIEV